MRILPQPDAMTEFYWNAAARHELQILRCRSCGFYVHYPRESCPKCSGADLAPQTVSGRGTIHSFTIAHHEAAGIATPFALVLVELEEQKGLRLVTNLIDVAPDEVEIGMPVEVVFDEASDDITLPSFRRRTGGAA